jgi:hypothetical protein
MQGSFPYTLASEINPQSLSETTISNWFAFIDLAKASSPVWGLKESYRAPVLR